jgi:hypothetical protein
LAYKRGGEPPAAGGRATQTSENTSHTTHTLLIPPQHLQSSFQGLGGHASSPALLVLAPLQAPPVLSNIVPRARPCWTYGPAAGTRIKSLCHLLLSIDH